MIKVAGGPIRNIRTELVFMLEVAHSVFKEITGTNLIILEIQQGTSARIRTKHLGDRSRLVASRLKECLNSEECLVVLHNPLSPEEFLEVTYA